MTKTVPCHPDLGLNPSSDTYHFYDLNTHHSSGKLSFSSVQFSSVVSDSMTAWIVACQASLSITNFQYLLKPMSIESVMPCNHLILWRPLLLPPSIFPIIRVFSNELLLPIRKPTYWRFGFQ